MAKTFDDDAFLRRSSQIIIHSKGKTFNQLNAEIEALRREHKGIRDKAARKFIRRNLSRHLFMAAVDTLQLPAVVERLYKRNVRIGFTGPQVQLASALEYAYYCSEHGIAKKGLRVLQEVRKAM